VDSSGDVNPSILPGRISGPGGFPVIAGGGPRIYFGGAFTAGRSRMRVGPQGLEIAEDGKVVKFVKKVYRTLFSGRESVKHGKEILYVTERAVFRLTKKGVVLEEIAPGVDLEKHVLRKMQFEPIVSRRLRKMDKVLFRDEKMGIRDG